MNFCLFWAMCFTERRTFYKRRQLAEGLFSASPLSRPFGRKAAGSESIYSNWTNKLWMIVRPYAHQSTTTELFFSTSQRASQHSVTMMVFFKQGNQEKFHLKFVCASAARCCKMWKSVRNIGCCLIKKKNKKWRWNQRQTFAFKLVLHELRDPFSRYNWSCFLTENISKKKKTFFPPATRYQGSFVYRKLWSDTILKKDSALCIMGGI